MTISATRHAQGEALAAHFHERAYFCFVAAGQFAERAGGGTHACGPGTLVFHPPGDVHADVFAAPTRCVNIELTDELVARGGLGGREQRRGRNLAGLAARIARELGEADAASGLALQGLVLELAAEWMRVDASPRTPAWLAEVEKIIEAEFATGVECRAIAMRVGVHPVQLSRAYRRAFGVTMSERIAQLRVAHAAHLLRTTRRTLAQIALDAGFVDQSHLSRRFQQQLGTTCARYRAARRLG